MVSLLPRDALAGLSVGISVSESPDLGRLGLLESHLRISLAEITRCVLVAGGTLVYGGHLASTGYTAFMWKELERYARRDQPLRVYLPWQEHLRAGKAAIEKARHDIGLLGEIVCLDIDGNPTEPTDDSIDAATVATALTNARNYIGTRVDARILVGGKLSGFQGWTSGLIEEAIVALRRRTAVYLAGGFGGATLAIARTLGVDDGGWLPDDARTTVDPRVSAGLAMLATVQGTPGWQGLGNGLDAEENTRLACTHRPR